MLIYRMIALHLGLLVDDVAGCYLVYIDIGLMFALGFCEFEICCLLYFVV